VRRYGINVNLLHPGGFANTRMVRETVPEATKGLLPTDSIAAAAVALAAQPPRGKTGQIVDAQAWAAAA
jgi:3-oxoacyl-[acyl-carrier protein] reductase